MVKKYSVLALKNLKRRGLRSWLTMLGIFIGIAAVVSLISLGAALENAVLGQFGDLGSDKLTVTSIETGFGPPGSTAVTKFTDEDIEIIESVNGVEVVVPRYLRTVQVNYRGDVSFMLAGSIPEETEKIDLLYNAFNLEPAEGGLIRSGETGVILVGDSAADSSSFERRIEAGDRLEIQGENFRVAGILEPTGNFILDQTIALPEEDMERILDLEGYDIIAVQVSGTDSIERIAEDITDELRRDRDQDEGEEDFQVQTPLQTLSAVGTILNVINLVVISIALISLFVGGIGITNTMYTSVLERKKEIGIMKAVGARNRDVLTLFLMESGLLGLVGGIIGAIFGLALAFLAAFAVNSALSGINFDVTISIPLLALAVLFSFVVGAISGILPALQAANMNTVEALRK